MTNRPPSRSTNSPSQLATVVPISSSGMSSGAPAVSTHSSTPPAGSRVSIPTRRPGRAGLIGLTGLARLDPVLGQLVAAGLERPADLAVDAGLGERDARRGRHLGHDLHVVLGPAHGLVAPVAQGVVGRAA